MKNNVKRNVAVGTVVALRKGRVFGLRRGGGSGSAE